MTNDDARPPGLIETAFLASLEKAINAALRHDPATQQRLCEHGGRLVHVCLTLPRYDFFVLILEDGVEFYSSSVAQADASVHGGPVDLLSELLEWHTSPGLVGGPLQIRGDRELLQKLASIAKDLDVDWGGLFSPLLGEDLAQQLDNGARRTVGWLKRTATTLGQQLSDFLNQESNLIPDRREIREFGHDVDELRMDTDRLEACISQLERGRSH